MDGVSERVQCPTSRQPGKAELEDAVDIDAMSVALSWAVAHGGAIDSPATARA